MIETVDGPPIVAGYEWRMRVAVTAAAPPFPAGCELAAHVRASVASAAILATLTTLNGKIVRVDDATIELAIPQSETAAIPVGDVVLDLVRTDQSPKQYLGFRLTIPVVQPVTRGLA